MKTKQTLLILILLFFLMGGTGCEKAKNNYNCCAGKILYIRTNDVVVQITSSLKDELPIGSFVSFDPDNLPDQYFKEGTEVIFKIKEYKKENQFSSEFSPAEPIYVSIVEPCKN